MPRYYYHLRNGSGGVEDVDGVALASLDAAREYAIGVARELMFRCETKRRHWMFVVCDSNGVVLFEVPFVEVDSSLSHLGSEQLRLIKGTCKRRLALGEAVYEARMNVLEARAIVGRARLRPYLVTQHGRRLVP